MTMAAIGIVGGLGAFLYGPLLTVCFLFFVIALHRSGAVAGLSLKKQVACYTTVVLVSGSVLWGIGRLIEAHKEHPITASQIAEAVWSGHVPEPPQQVTNVYELSKKDGYSPPAIERMSDAQLRAKVFAFSKSMRDEGARYKNNAASSREYFQRQMERALSELPNDTAAIAHLREQQNGVELQAQRELTSTIAQEYVVLATEYHDELVRRLGPQPPIAPYEEDRYIWSPRSLWNVRNGPFYYVMSLYDTADNLDLLARKLP